MTVHPHCHAPVKYPSLYSCLYSAPYLILLMTQMCAHTCTHDQGGLGREEGGSRGGGGNPPSSYGVRPFQSITAHDPTHGCTWCHFRPHTGLHPCSCPQPYTHACPYPYLYR